jgi:hypothetical protein
MAAEPEWFKKKGITWHDASSNPLECGFFRRYAKINDLFLVWAQDLFLSNINNHICTLNSLYPQGGQFGRAWSLAFAHS